MIYNSRRWWYQPQALVREKSGLTDSPGIWFFKGILRSHAYDEKTLELLVGKQVSPSSWKIGDMVAPKKLKSLTCSKETSSHGVDGAIGRIVHETPASGSFPVRMRVSGSVNVVFVSKAFAESTSLQTGSSFKENPFALESRRVSISRLVHTSTFHGLSASQKPRKGVRSKTPVLEDDDEVMDLNDMNETVSADFKLLKVLDVPAIERITKECDKSSISLITLIKTGLPKFVLQALDCVMENIQISKNDENLARAISALGKLALRVAGKTFPHECCASNAMLQGQDRNQNQHRRASEDLNSSNASSIESNFPLVQDRSNYNPDLSHEEQSSRVNRSTSLIERRRMLFSLMSRARRSGGDSLGEIISREMHLSPSLEMSADVAEALFFAPPSSERNFQDSNRREDDGRLENSRPSECTTSVEGKPSLQCPVEKTFIDKIYRGRGNGGASSCDQCVIPLISIKNIVSMGILGNSLPWLKAFLHCFAKKIARKNSISEYPILKHACDDDGMPLLHLAIIFGCSKPIIEELIRYGAPVGKDEIQLAADIDLPDVLSILLRHQMYSDGMIDLDKCSQAVAEVVLDATRRQAAQHETLRMEVDSFLVTFTQKLVQICLKRRQQQQQKGNDILGRTIACTLVGNTELSALRKTQQRIPPGDAQTSSSLESAILEMQTSGMDPCGLLQVLPLSILGRSLSEQPSYLTNLLLLIEDFLCSKDINDGCVGLTFLSTLLERFPSLNQSLEMERYGFAELVDSHAALSLNRLTEISSRVSKRNFKQSNSDLNSPAPEVIFCPKKHIATLHITKHSSFRCDLCGVSVKCGATMHGCRECDWDACETCTDRVEGGIMKWNYVRDLASKCHELLSRNHVQESDNQSEEGIKWAVRMVECLNQLDNTSEVNTLSIRLLQRDPDAIKALAFLLKEKGRVTMHQFLMVILPSLHSTLMGKSSSNEQHNLGRRTKKPRVIGIASRGSVGRIDTKEEERLVYAREILKSLVNDSSPDCDIMEIQEDDQTNTSMHDSDGKIVSNNDGTEEHVEANLIQKDERVLAKQLPEFLRRLHQVLALHEDVGTLNVAHFSNTNDVSPGNLRSLKEKIKLRLRQEKFIGSRMQNLDPIIGDVTIFSEPLVSVHDLSHQILKTASTTHPDYSIFCRQLVDDSAIILERPISSVDNVWRIAKILSYNGKTGCHDVSYATGFLSESSNQDDCFYLKYGDDFPLLDYETNITKLVLSARKFVIIDRDKPSNKKSAFDMEQLLAEGMVSENAEELEKKYHWNEVGSLVESDYKSSSWATYTVVGVGGSEENQKYDILSEDGEVFCDVPANRIIGIDPNISKETEDRGSEYRFARPNSVARQNIEVQGHFSRAYPFLMSNTGRHDAENHLSSVQGQPKTGKRSLKRRWSALASVESMCPVGVNPRSNTNERSPLKFDSTEFNCSLGCRKVSIHVDRKQLEFSPSFQLRFNSPQSLSAIDVSTTAETTLVSLLHQLYQGEAFDFFRDEGHQIFYSLDFQPSTNEARRNEKIMQRNIKSSNSEVRMGGDVHGAEVNSNEKVKYKKIWATDDQNHNFMHMASFFDYGDLGSKCVGLDEICIQCMEILEFLARINTRFVIDKKENGSVFVNEDLSQKLTKQTEDPLFIVAGIIPEWCLSIPTLTPNMYVFSSVSSSSENYVRRQSLTLLISIIADSFSYTSRKVLLDRVAFGVSRSTLRQQDAKVNIGRLRQRMTSLRARAVELVGEAFSGGAEDPTALQLQADELYGMEEVRPTFLRLCFCS